MHIHTMSEEGYCQCPNRKRCIDESKLYVRQMGPGFILPQSAAFLFAWCFRRRTDRKSVQGKQAAALALVGLLPARFDTAANMLVSFSCAMQVQAFRKVQGYGYASTMCIGNLRSGTESLSQYFRSRDKRALHKALNYFGIIPIFAVGAGAGGILSGVFGIRTIWICVAVLFIVTVIMMKEE